MSLVKLFSRISISNIILPAQQTLRNFQTTPALFAEPLKKKKRMDPAIIRAREERKKKKLEKQIRRLERSARQLKPIEECEISFNLIDKQKTFKRKPVSLTTEKIVERVNLEKQWAKYKRNQHLADIQMMDRVMYSQQRALDELRKESEELYQEAIQPDLQLLPFKSEGPKFTAPIENYEAPDGDYQDISKVW